MPPLETAGAVFTLGGPVAESNHRRPLNEGAAAAAGYSFISSRSCQLTYERTTVSAASVPPVCGSSTRVPVS